MSISLKKNASVSLKKEGGDGLSAIMLGVGWDVASSGFLGKILGGGGGSIDLDASCIAFDASGRVIDTVWFQQLVSNDRSIRHSGDKRCAKPARQLPDVGSAARPQPARPRAGPLHR